jgi:hypothetical protein
MFPILMYMLHLADLLEYVAFLISKGLIISWHCIWLSISFFLPIGWFSYTQLLNRNLPFHYTVPCKNFATYIRVYEVWFIQEFWYCCSINLCSEWSLVVYACIIHNRVSFFQHAHPKPLTAAERKARSRAKLKKKAASRIRTHENF